MDALREMIKATLMEHQHNYDMISIPSPTSYCVCDTETQIDLPEDITRWNSHLITCAKIEAHAQHQTEMILKKISE